MLAAGALIPVGYLIHQFWFAVFEARGGYVTSQRPNLAYLMQDYNTARDDDDAEVRHAYYAWEDWIYSGKVPNGHLQRARRLWQLFHGLGSSALASFLAVLQTAWIMLYLTTGALILLAVALVVIGVALAVRARTILREVHEWELMMAVEDMGPDGPHQLREGVKRFLDVERKMGRRMRAWRDTAPGAPPSSGSSSHSPDA